MNTKKLVTKLNRFYIPIVFVLLVFPAAVFASPYLYTFTGSIVSIENNLVLDSVSTLNVGDVLSYQLIIDFNGNGFDVNGEKSDKGTTDFVYSRLVSSPYIVSDTDNLPILNSSGQITSNLVETGNFISAYTLYAIPGDSYFYKSSLLFGDSGMLVDAIYMINFQSSDGDAIWNIGETFKGIEHYWTGDGFSRFTSTLTLASITAIPEPSTILLFLCGLAGLMRLGWKREKG